MEESEIMKVLAVVKDADNGCPVCVENCFEALVVAMPYIDWHKYAAVVMPDFTPDSRADILGTEETA